MSDKELAEIMIYMGITPDKQGYNYIRLVIGTLDKDPNLKLRSAYELVSAENKINPCTLDSSIRNAIHAAYDSGKLFRLNKLIGIDVVDDRICPTNREFIMLFVNHMKFFDFNGDNSIKNKDLSDPD